MPLIPSVCEVQRPLWLCLRSGAVGGLLTCRHGAFHCQCLPIPQPSEEPRWPCDAHQAAEKTLYADRLTLRSADWQDVDCSPKMDSYHCGKMQQRVLMRNYKDNLFAVQTKTKNHNNLWFSVEHLLWDTFLLMKYKGAYNLVTSWGRQRLLSTRGGSCIAWLINL